MTQILNLHTPHGNLHGLLTRTPEAHAIILLARTHRSAVDAMISANLASHGYAILSMDLLTTQEAHFADATQNVPRLAQRLIDQVDFVRHEPEMGKLPLGIFANGEASAAAVRAAAQRDTQIHAIACHGGVIDRAGKQSLELLSAPLLMLCDHGDEMTLASYERSKRYLSVAHEFHQMNLSEDPVLRVATWFSLYLQT